MGPDYAVLVKRGTVNVGILVYSLWMALLCTGISLLLGYPAAYFMADREMKLGSTLVVLFIIPMWMNFLLRTVAWMTLLEDQGLINTVLRALGLGSAQLMYNDGACCWAWCTTSCRLWCSPFYTSLTKMTESF
jgi:spermidine/putrescine transport system permease protein